MRTLHHSILATEGESTDERGVHHEWRVDEYDVVGALLIVVKTFDDALEYPDDPCSVLEQPCHEVFVLIQVSIHMEQRYLPFYLSISLNHSGILESKCYSHERSCCNTKDR